MATTSKTKRSSQSFPSSSEGEVKMKGEMPLRKVGEYFWEMLKIALLDVIREVI